MTTGILFAHPDRGVQAAAAAALEAAGFCPHTVNDGAEVLEWLGGARDDLFDLVVVAADEPGLDGVDVLRKIRDDLRHQSMPIIVFDDGDGRKHVVEGFAATFLRKGASFHEDLLATVRQIVPA